jgi:hypothetical protein
MRRKATRPSALPIADNGIVVRISSSPMRSGALPTLV